MAFAVSVGVRAEAEQAPPKIVFEPPTAERARGSELGVLDDSRVPVVRIVYLVPSDRVPDPEYPSVLVQAAHHFRAWLYQQLGNRTFQLHAPVVETYQTTHPASWYQGDRAFADLYYRAAADGFAAAGGGRYLDPDFIWLFAIDADAACTQCETCGAAGVAVLAAGNLRGLAGRKQPDACGRQPRFDPPCQFTGVLGHSLGQALGMDSADVCQRGDPACWEGEQPPGYGLSELGYVFYPRTWLLDDDVATLNASAFISAQPPPPTFDCALIAPCTPADEQRCAGVCSFDGAAVETGQTGATADMVKNGSFEDCAFSRDGEPQGWRRWARYPSDAGFTWDETRARDGGKSIKISAATPNDQYWSQQVAVTPNRWYRLSAWVRAVNVAHSDEMVDAGANVGLRDTYTFSTPIFGTKGWTQVTLDFNSGDSDEVGIAARLGYSFGGTTGTAWFDGLTLELLPSTPTPSPTPSASPTPTPTDTSTPTPSATEPPTSTPTETETATEVPTSTHTETSTQTPLPSATSAPTQSPTLGPTEVDTETPTETPSRSLEPDATATASENADPSPTPSPVETPTTSPSEPPLETPTDTPPATIKIEPTAVATETVEPSPTASIAELPTVATTAMPTDTPVETPSPTMIAETPTIEIPTPPVEPVATNTMPPTQSPTDATAAPATTTAGPLPTETAVAPTTALPISTATVKPPASPSRTSTRSAFPKATVTPRLEPETCPGDCDGDQNVTSAELVSAVRIALALADPLACAALDRNEDRAVTIDELVGAITAAIDGCAPPSAP